METQSIIAGIYEQYRERIYGYFISRVNNAPLAEDLCSEVFLKLCEKYDSFDETKASLSTWMYTVTRNTLTDYYRGRRVTEELPETISDGSDMDETLCHAEMLDMLADALEKLDGKCRDVIILHYYSGLTLRDIAVKMGISYTYVKYLHNRALAEMRKNFE